MRQRTSYPKPFKAQIVQECLQPGMSMASVALRHGINANLVRKWIPLHRDCEATTLPAFVPIKLPSPPQADLEMSVSIDVPFGHQKPHREVAAGRSRRVCPFYPWSHSMIRIDAIWLATEPMDMRAGTETALARVVTVFGAAKPHCAYIFANRRANRMKVLVHDGIGVWLSARRLNQGKFHWPGIRQGSELELDAEQLQALVLGLPWQRVGAGGAITIL
ncbi:IS66 family insertion sequence element accessory protein TnpB [Pseudomonas sp. S1_F04]